MKDYTPKESPLTPNTASAAQGQQDFFTAEEAILFMESRIRSSFRQ